MRYIVLATDYDETLADHGRVLPETLAALEKVKASGRKLVLVSGRDLPDLRRVFAGLELFDAIVAENGAVLYDARRRQERALAEPSSGELVERLRARGVYPLHRGRVVVATREPHQHAVLDEIQRLGLELQVLFNKGAVMALPAGVHKGTGLRAALDALGLSLRNCVAIGDAENDHHLLADAECGVAVANALPSLRERADLVTSASAGAGVIELCNRLIAGDLEDVDVSRRLLAIGEDEGGHPVHLRAYGPRVLFAGSPGSGKSTAAMATLERLIESGYQCLILDPEGDYERFDGAFLLGSGDRPPTVDEVVSALAEPTRSVAVNLVGVPLPDRPPLFAQLLPRLIDLRTATGRPHWIVVDEAHHLVPAEFAPTPWALPTHLHSFMVVTVVPHEVSAALLERIDTVVVAGRGPARTFADFAKAAGRAAPRAELPDELEDGDVARWEVDAGVRRYRVPPTRRRHQRHLRKYAQGEIPRDRSFYFRGPDDRLNLRAHNLTVFAQIAEGIDDETWVHHLDAGDYAQWFREVIKDAELAAEVEGVAAAGLPADESRRRVVAAIQARYTLPVGSVAAPA